MKTIKIIDLLNKIVNGEEVPDKISIRGNIFYSYSCSSIECYYRSFNGTNWLDDIDIKLDDEIEILDEEDEFEDVDEVKKDLNFHKNWKTGMCLDYQWRLVDKVEELIDINNQLIKNQNILINKINKRVGEND